MKIYMTENEGCFAFDMTAETMADAALLARFSNTGSHRPSEPEANEGSLG